MSKELLITVMHHARTFHLQVLATELAHMVGTELRCEVVARLGMRLAKHDPM